MTTAALKEQFQTLHQQKSSVELGIWLFLMTELLLFGSLITCYAILRLAHPEIFYEAGQLLKVKLGAINTAVLLTSSLTMALAVHAAEAKRRWTLCFLLVITALLGLGFLGIKAFEYHAEWQEHIFPNADFHFPGEHQNTARLFFVVYLTMTALHAFHLAIGILWLSFLAICTLFSGRYVSARQSTFECAGLYWHFVDIVWIFLFPLLYLIGVPQ